MRGCGESGDGGKILHGKSESWPVMEVTFSYQANMASLQEY